MKDPEMSETGTNTKHNVWQRESMEPLGGKIINLTKFRTFYKSDKSFFFDPDLTQKIFFTLTLLPNIFD